MNKAQNLRPPKMTTFPKKDQGIILTTDDHLKLCDYVRSISELVESKNILFASKISNNRICIYLSSSQKVEELVSQHTSLDINGIEIGIRRLVNPAKRIIFSNVCPSIPHSILENLVKGIGLNMISSVSCLKAGIPGEEFSHILSFRRQVYVQPNEEITLPSSIVVKFEDTNYRIFLNYDDMTCYLCKTPGHIASQCPQQLVTIETSANPDTNENENLTESTETNEEVVVVGESPKDITPKKIAQEDLKKTIKINQKRQRDSWSSSSKDTTNMALIQDTDREFIRPKEPPRQTKKPKTEPNKTSLSVEEQLESGRHFYKRLDPPPQFSFEQLIYFFENTSKCPDPLSLAKEITNDVNELIQFITDLYPELKHKGMKQRCTKIRNRLQRQLENQNQPLTMTSDTDTDCSQSSLDH